MSTHPRIGSRTLAILRCTCAAPQTPVALLARLDQRLPWLENTPKTTHTSLTVLERYGYVRREGRGQYALTRDGEAYLEQVWKEERPRG